MPTPGTPFQLIALFAVLLPGAVHATVRSFLDGPSPSVREATMLVLRTLVVSALYDALYLLCAGGVIYRALSRVGSTGAPESVWRDVALIALLTLFIIPASAAAAAHFWLSPLTSALWGRWGTYDPTPAGWDFALSRAAKSSRSDRFLLLQLRNGQFVAGLFGAGSFAASWPDAHDIFLEDAWSTDADGQILESLGRGIWVAGPEIVTMEIIPPAQSEVVEAS